MKVQDQVKKTTGFIAIAAFILTVIMVAAMYIFHNIFPEKVSFDGFTILSAFLGWGVAIADFFWMSLTVQKVVEIQDRDRAIGELRVSYRYRTFLKVLWMVLCIALSFLRAVPGILPLVFPALAIKLRGVISFVKFH